MKGVPNLFFSALYSSVKHGYPALLSFFFSLMPGPSPLMGQIAGFYTLLFWFFACRCCTFVLKMSFFTLWSGAIMLLCCGSTSCQAVWRNAAPSAGGSLAERQRSVPRRVLNCGQNARGSGSRVLTEPSSPPGEKHKNESQQSSLQCCSPRYFDFFNRPLDMWR